MLWGQLVCLRVISHSIYINSRKTTGSPFKTDLESDRFLLSPILTPWSQPPYLLPGILYLPLNRTLSFQYSCPVSFLLNTAIPVIFRKWKTYLAIVLLKTPHWNPIEWSPRAQNPCNGKPCHIKGWLAVWHAYQICPLHSLITHELGMVLYFSMVKKFLTVEYMKFNFQCPCE